MKKSALILCTIALGLSGCAVAPPTRVAIASPAALVTDNVAQISGLRAVALFDSVCGASLPGFATAPSLMAANGITVVTQGGTPTLFSMTEDVSFQVQDGPGQGRTCSMVFGSTETQAAITAAFANLGQFVETPLGPGTIYRDTSAVVLIGGSTNQGLVTLRNLRLLSER